MPDWKRYLPTALLFLFVAYLSWHFVSAEGWLRHAAVLADIEAAEAELAQVRKERLHLEDRVARLSPEHGAIDLDYLEERVRAVLNFAHPDEIVVRLEPAPERPAR